MKNPFRKKHDQIPSQEAAKPVAPLPIQAPPPGEPEAPQPAAAEPVTVPDDGFTEWRRSRVRGGVERRERNDIYEEYSVYGADRDGRLTLRFYHRYPEHERGFSLSYSRELTFDDFNRRLLAQLDSGGLTLADYRACICEAERITGRQPANSGEAIGGFDDKQEAALRAFCDGADILKDQSYLHSEGVLSCECTSAVGEDRLVLRFRRPLTHDALGMTVSGVTREAMSGYDIDNLWIMGVFNRLRERCSGVEVWRLTSVWSIAHESLWLMRCEGFDNTGEAVLIAVGEADSFLRFGFYSLDFSKK